MSTSTSSLLSSSFDYILGNPPFIGARNKTSEQAADIEDVFKGWKNAGNLDYVTCWFKKAAEYCGHAGRVTLPKNFHRQKTFSKQ